jgi:hypothetical protein
MSESGHAEEGSHGDKPSRAVLLLLLLLLRVCACVRAACFADDGESAGRAWLPLCSWASLPPSFPPAIHLLPFLTSPFRALHLVSLRRLTTLVQV